MTSKEPANESDNSVNEKHETKKGDKIETDDENLDKFSLKFQFQFFK